MMAFENESNKERLERIIRHEILPKLESIADAQLCSFIELLIQNSKLKTVAKDQYLEESGAFEDGKLFYLNSGIARTFYYDPISNKPVISRIWKKGEVLFDVNSFRNKENRLESIQMLEDGEILTLSYGSLSYLLDTFPNMVSFLLCLQAEREKYALFYQRLLKLSVEDRVRLYLNDNSGISNRINKDCIATHLGISRSKFSSAYALYKQRKNKQLA